MSNRTANRAKANSKQQTVTRRRKPQPVKASTQKSKVVNLTFKAHKRSSDQFRGQGLITGLYIKKSVLALLDAGQKTVDLSFAPHESQPKNSFRFAEQGDVAAIGSLYLMKSECGKLGITAKSNPRVRLQRNGKNGVKVTVTA